MKYLIIYAHFNEESFNHAVLESVQKGLKEANHEFKVRDLNKLKFNPVLNKEEFFDVREGKISKDVLNEQEMIKWADCLIFVYPIWWMGMPAILKGYIDRVFTYGFAYKYSENKIVPLLKDKKAVVVNTMGANLNKVKMFLAVKAMNVLLEKGIFGFCGIKTIGHKYFGAVGLVTDSERKKMLLDVEKMISKIE